MTKAGNEAALLDHLPVAEGGGADAEYEDEEKVTIGRGKSLVSYSSDTAATVSMDNEGRSTGSNESSASSSPPPRLHDLPYLVTAAASSALLSPTTVTSRLQHLCPALSLFAVVVILLAVGGILMALYHSKLLGLTTWMQERAPNSAFYYGAFVVLWVVLCLPSTFVELCGGFIFGFPVAFITTGLAKPTGCCLAFLLGRCVAADSLRNGLLLPPTPRDISSSSNNGSGSSSRNNSRRARALFLAMEKHPWKMCLLLRFMYLPIAVKNYGMATLPCPFHIFALCTLAASLPYTLLWAHTGASSRSLYDVVEGNGGRHGGKVSWEEVGVVIGGLLLAVVLAFFLRFYTVKYMGALADEEEREVMEEEEEEEEERREIERAGGWKGQDGEEEGRRGGKEEEGEALLAGRTAVLRGSGYGGAGEAAGREVGGQEGEKEEKEGREGRQGLGWLSRVRARLQI